MARIIYSNLFPESNVSAILLQKKTGRHARQPVA